MAVSTLTDNELVVFSKLNQKQLFEVMKGKSVKGAMKLRKDLQMALASYSKRRPAIGRFDYVQGKTILICKMIEMWARSAFFKAMLPKLVAARPALAGGAALALARPGQPTILAGGDPRTAAKIALREKWEKFLQENSY